LGEANVKYWYFRLNQGETLICDKCKKPINGGYKKFAFTSEAIRSDYALGKITCENCFREDMKYFEGDSKINAENVLLELTF